MAPGASVNSKSGSFALPGTSRGEPSSTVKRKSPGASVKVTPTSAAFLSDAAAVRPALLLLKKRASASGELSVGLLLGGVPAGAEESVMERPRVAKPPLAGNRGLCFAA